MTSEDVRLGNTYTDDATGFTGVCTGVFHYLNGDSRVTLETVGNDGAPLELTVDVGRIRQP